MKTIFLFLFFGSLNAYGAFNDMDCLNINFKSQISHKGAPLGLTENILRIQKSLCVITIEHEKLKFFNKKWDIDVCRGPVHIKSGTKEIEVLKRPSSCIGENKGHEFCTIMQDVFDIIQDDGLIFADGEKENLASDHGKTYCSFLLLKKYLEEGFILSRHNFYENFIVKGMAPAPSQENQGQGGSVNTEVVPAPTPTPTPSLSE